MVDMTTAQASDAQLIRCPSCGVTNRVTRDKLERGRSLVCGKCKTALPDPTKPLIVTDATFSADVERSPLPVLLDMWADWCGPCHMMAPVLDQLAAELAGRVRVAKMNVDENPVTSERLSIRSLPTLLVLKDGREIDRIVGVQPKAEVVRRLTARLS
jgi:thioredoxin